MYRVGGEVNEHGLVSVRLHEFDRLIGKDVHAVCTFVVLIGPFGHGATCPWRKIAAATGAARLITADIDIVAQSQRVLPHVIFS